MSSMDWTLCLVRGYKDAKEEIFVFQELPICSQELRVQCGEDHT